MKILRAQSVYGHTFNGTESTVNTNINANINTNGNANVNTMRTGPSIPLQYPSPLNTLGTSSNSQVTRISGGLTGYQLFQLKAQILAYKYLSRNMALPAKLLSAIRTFSQQSQGNLINML